MTKNLLLIAAISLLGLNIAVQKSDAKGIGKKVALVVLRTDTIPPTEVMDVIKSVIYSTNTFNIETVANLYTPNAVVADDEPPYSWNGPTAGIQWVNAVEKECRNVRLTKLKSAIESVNIYQQTDDNIYMVVPVSYTGDLPNKTRYNAKGAFTFVLRMINGKWLIKSQVWMPRKGM
jgi:ketosteroid isomerase-like protein